MAVPLYGSANILFHTKHSHAKYYLASGEKVLKLILTPDVQWPMLPRQYTLSKRVKYTAAVSVYQTIQTIQLFIVVYSSKMK